MDEVPRHLFVDEAMAHRAYDDTALPIGHGQTISQPYIVARMTEMLMAEGVPDSVLEVGTGSGYQAAVLSRLVPQVYTVERIKTLCKVAQDRFRGLQYTNINLRHSDGYGGWPIASPAEFPAIISTAASLDIPQALLEQLAPGGTLVIPVGADGDDQILQCVTKDSAGNTQVHNMEMVRFVPLRSGVQA